MVRRKSILIVEDQAIIAIAEKQQLEEFSYSVDHVLSGEDAVKTIINNDKSYDLILMDIDLGPGMDGTQAAAEILKDKDIPIVFLSSHIEPEVVAKTETISSYGYVVKDSGIVVLDASIKMALKLFKANIQTKIAKDKLESTLIMLQHDIAKRKQTEENLQIHKVELQLQNEELQEKQEHLENLKQKYFDLYELAPLGYLTLSGSSIVIEANLTAAALMGVSRTSVINSSFTSFIYSDDQDIYYLHQKKLFDSGEPQSCTLRICGNGDLIVLVFIKAVLFHNADDTVSCRLVMVEDERQF